MKDTDSFYLVMIEPTNKCNFACKFCFRHRMTRAEGFMSDDVFKKSLELCKHIKVPEVWLHNWGEPLLHPKILDFIKLASADFRVGMGTNGSLLNYEMVKNLKEAGLTYLNLSFNMLMNRWHMENMMALYHLANVNE